MTIFYDIKVMYLYFKLADSVLTCEEYPQILSVEEMKINKLENKCNKWEKNVEDGKFTFSFFEEDKKLYLQNSGTQDVVWVKPIKYDWCQLCEVNGYPNVYQWIDIDKKYIFALHINNGMLSDKDISKEINIIQEKCHIIFTECV